MTLVEAINAVETASVDLANADTAQAAAQAKFEAAKLAKETADGDDAAKVTAFNATLEQLIQAATAAKR